MSIDDPLQQLRAEHDAVLDVLDAMEAAVADLQGPRRAAALGDLKKGLASLNQDVRAHGQREEDVLYPALRRHVPAQTVDAMLEEHRDLWWAMDLLGQALEHGESHLNEVRWHATALVDLLRRHIDKENNVLFMMVAQMLSDEEYEELARAMRAMLQARQPPA